MTKRLQAPLVELQIRLRHPPAELLIRLRRLLVEQKIRNPHLLAEQKTRKQSKKQGVNFNRVDAFVFIKRRF